MTTDSTALGGRIERALHDHWVAEPAGGTATEAWTSCTCGLRITVPGGTRDEAWRRGDAHQAEQIAAAVLPLVRAAQADAWDEGHRASERDWEFAFDISTPDEDRAPWTNPYRAAQYERENTDD